MSDKLPAAITRLERGALTVPVYDGGTSTATIAGATSQIVSHLRDIATQGDDVNIDAAIHRETDGRVTMSLKFRSYKYRDMEGKASK
jgi:hypothetical protein